jgi:FkbM family methyltransferase
LKSLVNFFSLLKEFYYPAVRQGFYSQKTRKVQLLAALSFLFFRAKFSNDREVTVSLFGFRIIANSPQVLLRLVKEIFLEEAYKFGPKSATPKIIDGGSNIGISVLYFKSLYPQAQIIAIEPNPQAFYYLEKNIAGNSLSQVEVINACLSDRMGKERFYVSPTGSIINGSLYPQIGKSFLKEIDAVRLSDLLKEAEFDLVKLDVEGAERQVFEDLKESGSIKRSKQYLLEYHSIPGLGDIFGELVEVFEENGFKTPSIGNAQEFSTGGNSMIHYIQSQKPVFA